MRASLCTSATAEALEGMGGGADRKLWDADSKFEEEVDKNLGLRPTRPTPYSCILQNHKRCI